MPAAPIFFITGPPAVGKSTLSQRLLQHFEFGIHIPVDDLREWVVSGIAHPIGWNDETTRQFKLAETAAIEVAKIYNDAGFAVAIDHCSGPPNLDALIALHLEGRHVHKVALICSLERNLERNVTRTGKTFDASILADAIQRLNPLYNSEPIEERGWIKFDNSEQDSAVSAARLLEQLSSRENASPR